MRVIGVLRIGSLIALLTGVVASAETSNSTLRLPCKYWDYTHSMASLAVYDEPTEVVLQSWQNNWSCNVTIIASGEGVGRMELSLHVHDYLIPSSLLVDIDQALAVSAIFDVTPGVFACVLRHEVKNMSCDSLFYVDVKRGAIWREDWMDERVLIRTIGSEDSD